MYKNEKYSGLLARVLTSASALALVLAGGLGGAVFTASPAMAGSAVNSGATGNWDAIGSVNTGPGVTASALTFDADATITVDDGQDIGAVGDAAVTGVSINLDAVADGTDRVDVLVISGGTTTGSVVHGTIITTDLDATLDIQLGEAAAANSTGAATVSFFGDIVSNATINHHGTGDSTITFGNGTTGMTNSGNIVLNSDINGGITTVNIAASSVLAGTLDLAAAAGDAGTSVVINLAAGSSITGAVSDTANATLLTVNVDGNATISGAFVADTTTAANVEVDSGITLTLAGTGAFTVTSIDLDGGSLTVNAVKTVTGLIDGNNAIEGTLNIVDATDGESDLATFASNVGGTNSLSAINIGSSTKGGDASFSGTTAATTVTIQGGNAAAENAGAVFAGDATITTLNLTGGGAADADATATFSAGLATTTINLVDATGQAEMTVSAANGTQTISGTIDGGAAGQGALTVVDTAGAVPDAITFSGNVGGTFSLLSVDVGSSTLGGNAIFSGTLAATTITAEAGDAAAEDATVAVTGAVTATTLNVTGSAAAVAGTATFTASSNVTAPTINITGGGHADADATLNVAGNITATTITLDDATGQSFLVLNGGGAQTVTGLIDGALVGEGDISVTNIGGLVTFASAIGNTLDVGAVTTATGSKTKFSSTLDATTLSLGGGAGTTTTFDAAVTLVDAAAAFGNGTTITLGSGIVATQTVFKATANTASAFNTAATVNMPSTFQTGVITLVDYDGTTSTAVTDLALFTLSDNVLATYAKAGNTTTGEINITANAKSSATIGTELGITSDAAAALSSGVTASAGDTTALAAYNTALAANVTAATAALQSQPDPTGGVIVALSGGITQSLNLVSDQLASYRNNNAYASAKHTGMATGNGTRDNAFWMQGFGNLIDQDARGGIAGFDAATVGIATGLDTLVGDNTRLGVSLAYANSDVDGDGAAQTDSDIDSYQVALYGDYSLPGSYIEAMLGYAYNEVDTTRATVTTPAKGEYKADQYVARIGVGFPLANGNHVITPNASFQYTHVDNKAYTETGAGVLNLTVSPGDIDMAVGSIGAKYHTVIADGNGGTLVPELHASVMYDFIGDEATSSSTFAGGGAAFNTTGADVEQLGANLGAGLGFTNASGSTTIRIDYNAEVKEDFLGHTGRVNIRFRF